MTYQFVRVGMWFGVGVGFGGGVCVEENSLKKRKSVKIDFDDEQTTVFEVLED